MATGCGGPAAARQLQIAAHRPAMPISFGASAQLDIGRLAFVDSRRMREQLRDSGAAASARYRRVMQRMNTPHRILARDKAAFVLGTLGLA